ncbi:MAG: hypothetical protein ACREJ3_06090 [Polyangiaceae bacterium]
MNRKIPSSLAAASLLLALSRGALAQSTHAGLPIEITSMAELREKGLITQAEYESALHDLTESVGTQASSEGTAVLGKWSTTLYGFVESDSIWDSTRSFNDLAGAASIARANTLAGQSSRVTFSVRNSRIGFRLRAPETHGVRASAMIETDFLGTQLPVGNGGSEGAYFSNTTMRIRHFNLKLETPVVDVLAGQYWQLFGWQSAYQPNTVEIQGIPGELYARTPQVRISKAIHLRPVTIEAAVAATRPVQRDSGIPDGQGGVRFALDTWTGLQTVGATGTQVSPLSIAVTGLLRRVEVNAFSAKPATTNDATMSALAVDAFVPIVPATKDEKESALSLNAEFASGYGIADMVSGLTGGVSFPALQNPGGAAPPPAYAPDIDSGIVTYDASGALHPIQWTTTLVGAEYALPGMEGRLWISGNYSHMTSANAHNFGSAASVLSGEDWFDANVFWDPVPAVRLGLEYANFNDKYADGQHAINHRAQMSGFFIF